MSVFYSYRSDVKYWYWWKTRVSRTIIYVHMHVNSPLLRDRTILATVTNALGSWKTCNCTFFVFFFFRFPAFNPIIIFRKYQNILGQYIYIYISYRRVWNGSLLTPLAQLIYYIITYNFFVNTFLVGNMVGGTCNHNIISMSEFNIVFRS